MENNENNKVFTEKIIRTMKNIKMIQPQQLPESSENIVIENHSTM